MGSILTTHVEYNSYHELKRLLEWHDYRSEDIRDAINKAIEMGRFECIKILLPYYNGYDKREILIKIAEIGGLEHLQGLVLNALADLIQDQANQFNDFD